VWWTRACAGNPESNARSSAPQRKPRWLDRVFKIFGLYLLRSPWLKLFWLKLVSNPLRDAERKSAKTAK
jgi:hypothetical protein